MKTHLRKSHVSNGWQPFYLYDEDGNLLHTEPVCTVPVSDEFPGHRWFADWLEEQNFDFSKRAEPTSAAIIAYTRFLRSEGEGNMGQRIVKQPDGLYGIFSSVVDNFILVDATPQELIDFCVDEARERCTKQVNRQIDKMPDDLFIESISDIACVHGPGGLLELGTLMDGWHPSDSDLAWAKIWSNPERDGTTHEEHEQFLQGIPPQITAQK